MRKGDWIQTFTGRVFWPLDPRPDEVAIEDIAHSLAMQCRYAGHCRRFYSVAEHCVHVSRRVPPADALWGLLHDASEAYLVDLPRPVKMSIPQYRVIEAGVLRCIAARFRLGMPEPESVVRCDKAIVHDERAQLMAPMKRADVAWRWGGEPLNVVIRGWTPATAERNFLGRFHQLMRLRDGQKEAA